MGDSLLTELSFEEYISKSLVPSTVIRLPADITKQHSEMLLVIVSGPPNMAYFRINLDLPDSIKEDPSRRTRQVAVCPDDLHFLLRKAWIDCCELIREPSHAELRSFLISHPDCVVGNFRKKVMLRLKI